MRLYSEIDWPPIEGVIAVQPEAVADLLRVTGSVSVDVDGEQRDITSENVFIEMERQRAQRRSGEAVDASHKDVIANVGIEIMDQLKAGNRGQIRLAAELMQAAADRRDIQIYSTSPAVMQVLDKRHWSGRVVPDHGDTNPCNHVREHGRNQGESDDVSRRDVASNEGRRRNSRDDVGNCPSA